MILKIRQVGDPVLRSAARELAVDEILSHSTQQLIEFMRETLRDAPGVGLAAPQVGESVQVAVVEDTAEHQQLMTADELTDRNRTVQPFHVVINPQIELDESDHKTFFEGCLSLPGYTALVSRATSARVTALDHRARRRVIDASGWYARILQHEIDHLRGRLYVDLMQTLSLTSLDNHKVHWRTKTRPS